MKLTQTAKLVVDCSPEEFQSTINHYTDAYNFTCKKGFKSSDNICTNGVTLHHEVYEECRKTLPSQLAISARMKATESLKSVQARIKKGKKATCPQSKTTAIRYDKNAYTLWLNKSIVSLSTCEGRKKFDLIIPQYFEKYLTWKYTSADLFVKGGKVFLHIVFQKEIEDRPMNYGPDHCIGIDRGINKLAVTSRNEFYDGKKIKRISQRYEKTRSELQSKGHSGKRHLRKLKSKEQRFRRDVNHCITKQIVNSIDSGDTIILENLKGIRNAKMRKKQRRELNKWNFYQFEQFLTYKAKAKNIGVEFVPARYTSQKCSRCGEIRKSNRKFQSLYVCKHCGLSLNADLNASRNIVQNYLDSISYPSTVSVNMPYAPSSEVEQAPRSLA